MTFLYLKAVHIIFIVTWFAGMFYIPRLFINLIESAGKPEPERSILYNQLIGMTSRLWYGITWPSAVLTLMMGTALLVDQPAYLQYPFMQIKLGLVVLLYAYHFSLHQIFKQLKRKEYRYTSDQMRIWNEVATILLISIVFLIVVKTALSLAWGLVGLLIVTIAIMVGIRVYKKLRK
jgi:protoporphyrinogen IX oxidase